jgi:hypothetical protein
MKVQAWHRRHALNIASQLPEDHDDALAVLCAAMDLVQGFLAGEQNEPKIKKPALTVVPIGGNECA